MVFKKVIAFLYFFVFTHCGSNQTIYRDSGLTIFNDENVCHYVLFINGRDVNLSDHLMGRSYQGELFINILDWARANDFAVIYFNPSVMPF